MNKYGAVGPLGTLQTTATVGGHTWNIYRGTNGANQVYSFVRTAQHVSSGTVDIKAIATGSSTRGWFGDVTIGNVQFGYEITSSSRRQGLRVQQRDDHRDLSLGRPTPTRPARLDPANRTPSAGRVPALSPSG